MEVREVLKKDQRWGLSCHLSPIIYHPLFCQPTIAIWHLTSRDFNQQIISLCARVCACSYVFTYVCVSMHVHKCVRVCFSVHTLDSCVGIYSAERVLSGKVWRVANGGWQMP